LQKVQSLAVDSPQNGAKPPPLVRTKLSSAVSSSNSVSSQQSQVQEPEHVRPCATCVIGSQSAHFSNAHTVAAAAATTTTAAAAAAAAAAATATATAAAAAHVATMCTSAMAAVGGSGLCASVGGLGSDGDAATNTTNNNSKSANGSSAGARGRSKDERHKALQAEVWPYMQAHLWRCLSVHSMMRYV
jgi:hypothetical protein